VRILLTVTLLISVFSGACGYHLRGAYDLPKEMKNIYLQGGSAVFREQLDTVLKTSAGKLSGTSDQADVVLRIFKDEMNRRVLSLSARGRSNDIELAAHLEYELVNKKNEVLVSREPIDLRREYFNDQQDVIAKDNEETVIKKEMYQQIVKTIINRSRVELEAEGK